MAYDYQKQRPYVFTEQGQVLFLEIRDRAAKLIAHAGAARLDKIMLGSTGDTWNMLACIDRLVELKELVEIGKAGNSTQSTIYSVKHSL